MRVGSNRFCATRSRHDIAQVTVPSRNLGKAACYDFDNEFSCLELVRDRKERFLSTAAFCRLFPDRLFVTLDKARGQSLT